MRLTGTRPGPPRTPTTWASVSSRTLRSPTVGEDRYRTPDPATV